VTAEELSFGVIVLAMLTALGVGAAHALEPGHGKAVVAAFLVGSRGTAWHAVFLGLVVTVAHTAGVFLLGLVTLYASRFMVPSVFTRGSDRLWSNDCRPWRLAVSAAVHDTRRAGHHHPGDHDAITRMGIITMTITHSPRSPRPSRAPPSRVHLATTAVYLGDHGRPSPVSGLVVLLGAIALRRIGFGLLLIVA
jgi:hypothetical protein